MSTFHNAFQYGRYWLLHSTENAGKFQALLEYAEQQPYWIGLTLQNCFDTLSNLEKQQPHDADWVVELMADSAPYSFHWAVGPYCGLLAYHGPHDGNGSGAGPTFATTIQPFQGWSIHT